MRKIILILSVMLVNISLYSQTIDKDLHYKNESKKVYNLLVANKIKEANAKTDALLEYAHSKYGEGGRLSAEYIITAVYKASNHIKDGIPYFENGLQFLGVITKKESAEYIDFAKDLLLGYFQQQQLKKAIPLAKELVELNKIVYKEDSEQYLKSLSEMGTMLYMTKQYEKALPYVKKAYQLSTKRYNLYDIKKLLINVNYAKVAEQNKDYETALKVYSESKNISINNNNKYYFEITGDIIKMLFKLKRDEEGIKETDRLLSWIKLKEGEDSKKYIRALNNTAIPLMRNGNYKKSLFYYKILLSKAEVFYGKSSKELGQYFADIAELYSLLNNHNKTIESVNKAKYIAGLNNDSFVIMQSDATLLKEFLKHNKNKQALDVLKNNSKNINYLFHYFNIFTKRANNSDLLRQKLLRLIIKNNKETYNPVFYAYNDYALTDNYKILIEVLKNYNFFKEIPTEETAKLLYEASSFYKNISLYSLKEIKNIYINDSKIKSLIASIDKLK